MITAMARNPVEPWLRGTITGTHPVLTQLLYCFEQAREDLEHFTEGLDEREMWAQPFGLPSVAFHIRHTAGSIDRLLTYARGEQLTDRQMQALKSEAVSGGGQEEILQEFRHRLDAASEQARRFDPNVFDEERKVGRKGLPTTSGALLVHIAEHTQRHVGQAIVTAKIVKAGAVR